MVFCFANIFVQASVNRFGSAVAAGSAVAMTFEYFAYYAITSLGQSATTFISQNYAANNFDRCRSTLKICLLLSFVSCAAMTVPLTVFCHQASALFTSVPEEIEMSCVRIMLILAFEPICTFYEIPAAAMRGAGHSALPAHRRKDREAKSAPANKPERFCAVCVKFSRYLRRCQCFRQ